MGARDWHKTITKLQSMDRRELLDRSRQELAKRADALLAACRYNFAKWQSLPAPLTTGKFLFGNDDVDNLLRLIRQRLPQNAEAVVSRAEKICRHQFDLLGYEGLQYGDRINWYLDLIHGKIAPRKPFYRVGYLDFDQVGDSKITWELNRHQHLVTLAKAYRLTGNDRFAQEILSQWKSWHAQNPYPVGINWASSLEVAFRSLSWIWVYALLDGMKFLTEEFRRQYLAAQAVHGRHIERYLSTYFSPNTHLLGEGVALFFLGTLCPTLPGAARWKTKGWRIVLQESERQVNPDGLHFEQSTYYHVYALDFFLHAALLASANGLSLGKKFEETLERMLNALFLLSRLGPPPGLGDDDGGRLFDPARNHDEHLLDPLATGAILFGRGDFKYLARELREETIWLLGEAGVAEWDRLETQPPALHSDGLRSSGIFLLSAPETRTQLAIKGGPAIPQSRGHSHADALSLCLHAAGRALLIDPGSCEYVAPERNLYRGTAMHNTVTVDGLDQADPDGQFSWKQELAVRTERWISGETFSLFVGVHDGYSRLAPPVRHHRSVLALNSGAFLVRDFLEGEGKHRWELSWRLAPDLQFVQEHLFRIKQSSQGLALLPVEKHGWSEQVHKGAWSPVYGAQRTTTVLKFATESSSPAEFSTLLVALPEVASIPGKFSRLESGSEFVRAYRYQTKEMDHQFYFSRAGQRWQCGRVASDAEVVCLLLRSAAESPEVILCNGSYLEWEGRRLLTAKRSVERCELLNRGGWQLFSSDPDLIAESALESGTKTPT
jgi:Heparinase II/III-like protein/Heparinase II/III N-terminus